MPSQAPLYQVDGVTDNQTGPGKVQQSHYTLTQHPLQSTDLNMGPGAQSTWGGVFGSSLASHSIMRKRSSGFRRSRRTNLVFNLVTSCPTLNLTCRLQREESYNLAPTSYYCQLHSTSGNREEEVDLARIYSSNFAALSGFNMFSSALINTKPKRTDFNETKPRQSNLKIWH